MSDEPAILRVASHHLGFAVEEGERVWSRRRPVMVEHLDGLGIDPGGLAASTARRYAST